MSFWDLIFTLVILGVILLLLFIPMGTEGGILNRKQNSRRAKDLEGAKASAAPLAAAKRFAMLHQYEIVSPGNVVSGDKESGADFLLVGCFGVLCVKCVGLGGTIYGGAGEAEWTRMDASGRSTFPNPLDEASAATRVVRDVLFAAKRKNVPVETVCVFTNPKAELALPRGTGHYTLKEFKALLQKDKFLYDKGVDEKAVAQLLREAVR